MKTAVITGATSGIGYSILKAFLDDGYTVYAGYRDIRHKKELTILSDNVIPFRIDLTKKWTIEEAIKFINDSAEKIDVLVNVAGKVVAGPLETLSVNKIREQFEVNTFSHLELAQGLFEKLDGGKIINMSSMASYGLFPFLAPYCASKRALDMLFNSLRIETGSKVKIVSVKPGVIATPLWKKSIDENKDNLGDGKYKIVGEFLIANAMKNSNDGLNPKVVAKKVLKIANSKRPKASYVIGKDAFGAKLISKLPQKFIDIIVQNQLIKKVKEQLGNSLEFTGAKNTSDTKEENYILEEQEFTDKESDEKGTVNKDSVVMDIYDENENPESKLQSALEDAIQANKPRSER